ncbi:MAG: hypothetical protein IMW98_04695 [Firmicutes bacterium]|nr:hypothetical protein [Bacillota bacterium]
MVPPDALRAYRRERHALVRRLIAAGALRSQPVARAFAYVPRHAFLPLSLAPYAYRDLPLTIRDAAGGRLATAARPSQLARVLESLELAPGQSVLVVGAGSGYAAALAEALVGPAGAVYLLEPGPAAREWARGRLEAAGSGVRVLEGASWDLPAAIPAVDRILVQVALADFPASWDARVPLRGRLAVPLALASPLPSVVAVWERRPYGWQAVAWLDGDAPPAEAPPELGAGGGVEARPGTRVAAPALDAAAQRAAWQRAAAAFADRCCVALRGRPSAVDWRGLRFWIGLVFGERAFFAQPPDLAGVVRDAENGAALGRDGGIRVWGTRPPAAELEDAVERWVRAGRPPLERFHVTARAAVGAWGGGAEAVAGREAVPGRDGAARDAAAGREAAAAQGRAPLFAWTSARAAHVYHVQLHPPAVRRLPFGPRRDG